MLEPYMLEQLVAVGEHKTLSKAARAVHVSQPAMSQTMRKIEAALGVTLFNRTPNSVELNETGKLAVQYAQTLLNQAEDARRRILFFDKSRTVLEVATSTPTPAAYLVPLLRRLYPQRKIHLRMMTEDLLRDQLYEGNVQIALMTTETDDDALTCFPLFDEYIGLAVSPATELAGMKSISAAQVASMYILAFASVGYWREIIRERISGARMLLLDDMATARGCLDDLGLPAFVTNLLKEDRDFPGGLTFVAIEDGALSVRHKCVFRSGALPELEEALSDIENNIFDERLGSFELYGMLA